MPSNLSADAADLPLLLRLRHQNAALAFEFALLRWGRAIEQARYNPDQPRIPAGGPDGGQWTSGGGRGDRSDNAPIRLADNANTLTDVTPSFVPRPDRFGWHDYLSGPHVICPASLQCTKSQMVDYLSRFAVPGQDPSVPTTNSSRNIVRDPWYGLPAGWVTTTITNDGLTVNNRTNVAHVLYDGVISRSVFENPDGSWGIATHGYGNNVIPGMAYENQSQGPKIFGAVDQAMTAYILRDHGRSKSVPSADCWKGAGFGWNPGPALLANGHSWGE